ncbi:hypothetical protein LSG25_09550 [Paralcaligenes sp. KSB-10]|uniref:hypothetical protein n=1 Tax=Paralcaligenes sp. KSB-10 TaxID=2901142 RepID=UPI001E2B85E7|nr:hypothetical protein [Paralcaligenes sp. KSB-10]UHL66075.1 hypothetical protein LSG25_09550 [Paralcaligenes sp. KSB-10]
MLIALLILTQGFALYLPRRALLLEGIDLGGFGRQQRLQGVDIVGQLGAVEHGRHYTK